MNTTSEYKNFPVEEVMEKADWLIKNKNAKIFFKFTCVHCGSRQTFDVPNTLYAEGKCEECGGITNIVETGCNYLLVL